MHDLINVLIELFIPKLHIMLKQMFAILHNLKSMTVTFPGF